jgi:hypothetical protein
VTLIVGFACPDYVLQVGDRLTTRKRSDLTYESWDELANKSVVFLARDACVAIGYSGPAFLAGMPTDKWIARAIQEDAFRGPAGGTRFGQLPRTYDIGQSLEKLVSAVDSLPTDRWPSPLTVQVIGWQWHVRKPREWPFALRLVRAVNSCAKLSRSPRYWGWERGGFAVQTIPPTRLDPTAAINARLAHQSELFADFVEAVVLEQIRSVSARLPTVGSDCMSILIQLHIPNIRLRYCPKATPDGIAYTPWILAPTLTMPPQALYGAPPVINIGDLEIAVEQIDLAGNVVSPSRVPFGMGHQPRSTPPSA